MDTRRRRDKEIAKERDDSEAEGKTVKTKRKAVDLVDVQFMSTSEEDDKEQLVEMLEMISEPMDFPNSSSSEKTSESEQEESIDNLIMIFQPEESEVCEEVEDDDATESEDETEEKGPSTNDTEPRLVNPPDMSYFGGHKLFR